MARTPRTASKAKGSVTSATPTRAAPSRAQRKPSRQAIVVLAMHRTGSSALSRVLNLAGCNLPKTLMGGDASNETGHWESTVVRALNDDILTSGGSDWQDWHAFNPDWYATARPDEFLPRAQQVMADEYGNTSLLVLKDPRMCRLFPFWRMVLEAEKLSPHVIMPLRHPAEVAASLYRRNRIVEVQGLLLWLRHVLEAEHASRGLPRTVVSYDKLLARPVDTLRAVQEPLDLVWPRLSEAVSAEIMQFMSPDLRHHKADPETGSALPFRDWLTSVFSVLHRWSEQGEDKSDWAKLDAVRQAMNDVAAPLREVILNLTRQSTEIAEQYKEIRYLRGEAGKRGDLLKALEEEKASLSKALEAEKSKLTEALASAKAAQEAAAAEAAKRAEDVSARDGLLVELRDEKAALAQSLDAEKAKLSEALASATTDKEAAASSAAKLAEELAGAQASVADLKAAYDALKAERDAERTRAAMREADQEQSLNRVMKEADSLRSELAQLAEKVASTEAAWSADTQRQAEEISDLIAQKMAQAEDLSNAQEQFQRQEQAYKAEIDRLQNDMVTMQETLEADRAERERLAAALTESQSALEAQRQATQGAETALAAASAESRALQGELASLEHALAAERDNLVRLKDRFAETQSALRQRQHEAEETASALALAQQDNAALQTELEARQSAHDEALASLAAAQAAAEQSEAARYEEISELTRTLLARETAINTQAERIHTVNAAYAKLNNTAEQLKAKLAEQETAVAKMTAVLAARDASATQLMTEITTRGAAIGHLMNLAEQGRGLAQRIDDAIGALMLQAERPWLRGRRQLARKAALLRSSGLFDAEWYAQVYPDVVESGQDPATHFILFGRSEGRPPLPDLARFFDQLPKPDAAEA